MQVKITENQWKCKQCTFINEINNWDNLIAQKCAVCGMENELKAQRKQEPPAKKGFNVASIQVDPKRDMMNVSREDNSRSVNSPALFPVP